MCWSLLIKLDPCRGFFVEPRFHVSWLNIVFVRSGGSIRHPCFRLVCRMNSVPVTPGCTSYPRAHPLFHLVSCPAVVRPHLAMVWSNVTDRWANGNSRRIQPIANAMIGHRWPSVGLPTTPYFYRCRIRCSCGSRRSRR